MERGIVWAGLGILVAGMITFGLGIYFVDLYGISHQLSLFLFGGFIIIFGLVTLAAGGALRFVGVLFLVVGLSGFVAGVLTRMLFVDSLARYLSWSLVVAGVFWGPAFMVIGLGALLAADWRKRAAVSA